MTVNPVYFQDNNRLNFRFAGRYTTDCNDPLSGLLWSTISDTSTLALTLERLPPQRDLSRLPLPFFDNHEKQTLSLPFMLPANAANQTLQAAAIVASWFGQLADYRGANFPVAAAVPADGNAVVIGVPADLASLNLPPVNGPTVATVANPRDPDGSLLVVTGRTGEEVIAAATALALGSRTLGDRSAVVTPPEAPARKPYDAPDWIATDRPVKFGELVDASELQGVGYVPGTMRVPFRTAPDLYTWRDRGFPTVVRYRAPPGPIIDLAVSRLDVGINNLFLRSLPLAQEAGNSWVGRLLGSAGQAGTGRLDVPPYYVFGQNDLQFFFDTRPLHRGACVAMPADTRESIDPDSTIDLSRAYRFASLPNLAFFVNSGFPFTRLADLSQSAAVLPDQPSPVELSAFLDLMGRIGALTGYPVIRLAVVRPGATSTVADRDLLVIGTLPRLGSAAELLRNSPFRLNGNQLGIELGNRLQAVTWLFDDEGEEQRRDAAAKLGAPMADDTAALIGTESPLHRGRSVVALLAAAPQALDKMVATMRDSQQAPHIQGDIAILSAGRATSYRVGSTYTVGKLPFWVWPSWFLRGSPVSLMGVMLAGCGLIALMFLWALRRRAAVRTASVRGA